MSKIQIGVMFEIPKTDEERVDVLIDVVESMMNHALDQEGQGLHPVEWSYMGFQAMLDLLQLQNRVAKSNESPTPKDIADMYEYWLKISSSCIGALESMYETTELRTTETG